MVGGLVGGLSGSTLPQRSSWSVKPLKTLNSFKSVPEQGVFDAAGLLFSLDPSMILTIARYTWTATERGHERDCCTVAVCIESPSISLHAV